MPTLSYTQTECQVARQASAAVAKSHWNALWRYKMGPISIPKHHGKRQNFKAATWRLMLGVFIPLAFTVFTVGKILPSVGFNDHWVKNLMLILLS